MQPVLVLTDHQAIEAWAKEVLDAPSGPVGRRSRWFQIFSKFDLSVGYIPGKNNQIADVLSRWAYPASQALRDISKHGSEKDDDEMRELIEQEHEEEKECIYVCMRHQPTRDNLWIRGVTTRKGTVVAPQEERDAAASEGEGSVAPTVGTNTQLGPHSPEPGDRKRLTFGREELFVDGDGKVTSRINPKVDECGNVLGETKEGEECTPS